MIGKEANRKALAVILEQEKKMKTEKQIGREK